MTRSISASLALAATLLLGGCATIPATPALLPDGAEKGAWLAMGNEPGWTLEITPGRLSYAGDYGATQIRVPVTQATRTTAGMRYAGGSGDQALSVDITNSECADTMADRHFAQTVSVTTNSGTVRGCGGPILPPVKLDGTQWSISRIGNATLPASSGATMRFEAKRLTVTVGCNQMWGNWRASQHGLTVDGGLAATRKGCPAPLDQYEATLTQAFAKPLHLRYTRQGGITLLGSRGVVIELVRNH